MTMYTFKSKEAEAAIRNYLCTHSQSETATRALNGDCAAMMELYEELCGPQEIEEGPSEVAARIINEAIICKYPPAIVRMAQVEMCLGLEYWPDALIMLLEAYELGSKEASIELQDLWTNYVKYTDERDKKKRVA